MKKEELLSSAFSITVWEDSKASQFRWEYAVSTATHVIRNYASCIPTGLHYNLMDPVHTERQN